jgi:hypothetical protein
LSVDLSWKTMPMHIIAHPFLHWSYDAIKS